VAATVAHVERKGCLSTNFSGGKVHRFRGSKGSLDGVVREKIITGWSNGKKARRGEQAAKIMGGDKGRPTSQLASPSAGKVRSQKTCDGSKKGYMTQARLWTDRGAVNEITKDEPSASVNEGPLVGFNSGVEIKRIRPQIRQKVEGAGHADKGRSVRRTSAVTNWRQRKL